MDVISHCLVVLHRPAALEHCCVCQSGPALQRFICGHSSCGDCTSTCCPQCGKKPRLIHPSQQVSLEQKQRLGIRCGSVSEGDEYGRCSSSLQKVYSELYITEGFSEGAREQHEVSQMEADSKKKSIQETVIRCSDIFKPLPTERLQGAPLRVVLTLGVAGAGKTFSVLKFCLDWAQGSENQELQLVVPLSFREMNLLTARGRYSLMELIQAFHPELPPQALSHSKVLIICDGLDESRLPLDFSCEVVSEVTQGSEVSALLVNLIRGDLLPHAQIWITSRPAAAGQIPAQSVHRVTEVRGFFTDDQKEQFFKKKFTDEETVNTVLSHLRTSRSLYNMCQIPLFSWVTATVLEHLLKTCPGKALPQTLTELYANFMMIQTKRKTKYHRRFKRKRRSPMFTKNDCELLLKLGRLAFEHLQKGNIMFYREDLEQVGLDLSEASVDSGLCTEIFKRERVVFDQKVYCFVHLSIQEFMAAVYIHHFMEVSLGSKTGHLDLFVRFLHGLSLETNHRVLGTLLGPHKTSEETILKVVNNLKEMNLKNISPDRSINIFHCLMEMNDRSVQQQIQDFLRAETSERKVLSEIQCSALAYMLQMSEQVLDELDLIKYNTTREGRWRLIPAVRNCRKALYRYQKPIPLNYYRQKCPVLSLQILPHCGVAEAGCSALASALRSSPCALTVLDLSHNELRDGGLEQVCGFLQSPPCVLQTLGLNSCSFSEDGCRALGSALEKNPSHLRELDVSGNELKDAGIKHLCGFLQSPECRLELLGSELGHTRLHIRSFISIFFQPL
uniref:NACHT domain-containing protein n=1 Tax=Neogobius melanostomus TaxID=47308 RepID=A0A8C6TV95_9GOBI